MHGRVQGRKSDLVAMAQPGPSQRVICEDKALMIEEAGLAYKDVGRVLADLEVAGGCVARPLSRALRLFPARRFFELILRCCKPSLTGSFAGCANTAR